MDTRLFKLDVEIVIRPIFHHSFPEISLRFDDNQVHNGPLKACETFKYSINSPRQDHSICIEFFNKSNSDSQPGKDKAVIIDKITFNGITSPNFIWQSEYTPNYPQPWASKQQKLGHVLLPKLKNQNYLGWNGTWQLNFSSPIFTWIHMVEDMGWIYYT